MQIYLYYFGFPIILASVNGFSINNTVEGYPVSFLDDNCPGSMNPVVISKNNLRFIKFHVYGAKSSLSTEKIFTYNSILKLADEPSMDWNKRTLMYLPGYGDSIHVFPMALIMKTVYRNLGFNVIVVNLLKFMTEEYPKAIRVTMAAGNLAGEMLAKVHAAQPKFDPKKLDLLGLSLGGQSMSFVAKTFKNITGIKIARLTGMDTAGPCFKNRGPEYRVDESDADFVDLLMTNIDTFGMAPPVGHVNIYVNGGEYQPGDFYWMFCGPFCSHARGYELWMASVMKPEAKFIAIKCDSVQDARESKCFDRKPMETIRVGPFVDRNARGIYYLPTTNHFPYALGEEGLKNENDFFTNMLTKLNSQRVLKL